MQDCSPGTGIPNGNKLTHIINKLFACTMVVSTTPSPRGRMMSPSPSPSARMVLNSPRGNRRSHSCGWRVAALARYGPFSFLLFAAYLSVSHRRSQTRFGAFLHDDSTDIDHDAEIIDLPNSNGAGFVSPFDPPPIDPAAEAANALKSYSPALHPILDPAVITPDSTKPLSVRFLTGSNKAVTSETRMLLDAIERSKYLKLVSISFLGRPPTVDILYVNDIEKSKAPVIWMVDFLSIGRDCHALETLVKHVKALDGASTHLQLILLDYSASWENPSCPNLEQLVPNIRLAKRGIVKDRHWDKSWVKVGKIAPNLSTFTGGPALYMPHAVRQVFVDQIKLAHPYKLKRSTDVIHFWRMGDNSHFTHLRDTVSRIVSSMQGTMVGTHRIQALVKTFGKSKDMDINRVHSQYVEETLKSKIIVVAQRDEYEDHYRLMESLASGAMVMTDVMLGLPSGFKDKENIIVYDSAESLRQLLIFYLNPKNAGKRRRIAQKGWELAMSKHRSWHRVEELLFGKPISKGRRIFSFKAPEKRKRSKNGQEHQFDLEETVIFSDVTDKASKEDDD